MINTRFQPDVPVQCAPREDHGSTFYALVIDLERDLFRAPGWAQAWCGLGFELLIGRLEWILVDLTPGALDLCSIQTAAEEEYKGFMCELLASRHSMPRG